MKGKLSVFLMLCLCTFCFGQFESKKSIQSTPKRKKIRSEKSYFSSIGSEVNYLDSAQFYKKSNPLLAIDFIETSLNSSLDKGDRVTESEAYQLLGEINIQLKKFPDAIIQLEKAIFASEAIKSDKAYEQYYLLGSAHYLNKNYDDALRYFYGFETYANVKNSDALKMKIKLALAKVYRAQGKIDKAEIELNNVIKLGKKTPNPDQNSYAVANGILGEILLNKDQDEKALGHLNTAYQSNSFNNEEQKIAADKLEEVLLRESKYDEAIELRKTQKQKSVDNKDGKEIINSNSKISEVYIIQDQWENAIPYLKENIALAKERNDIVALAEGYKSISKAYEGAGKPKEAIINTLLYTSLADSIAKAKEQKTVKLIAFNNELSIKQKRIQSLEKDRELDQVKIDLLLKNQEQKDQEVSFQRTLTYLLLAVLLIVLIASVLLYRSSQQKKLANQLLALKSLRSQMNPHFIFNALNSVNSFIAKNDERAANKYLADFSKLMRQVMENSKYDLVPLSSEIDILKIYLQLEHFRFSEKFDYEFILDEEIDIEGVEIPPMLIQPYVENAVWHGLRYLDEKGKLIIELKAGKNYVEFIISDNGIGRKRSHEVKTKNQLESKSTGMRNIENRLNILNDVNKMDLKVSIKNLKEKEQSGTVVSIQIPINSF